MDKDILVAIIGGIVSILVAWISQQTSSVRHGEKKFLFLPVLALGFSLTALFLSLFNFNSLAKTKFSVESLVITGHTAGEEPNYNRNIPYLIRNDPDISDITLPLNCPPGSTAIAAWHEIIRGDLNIMSNITAYVEENIIKIKLRARIEESGYLYIKIYAMCSSYVND